MFLPPKHSALLAVFPNVCFLHNFSSQWILHCILIFFFQNCLLIYWLIFTKHLKVLLIKQSYLSNRGKFPRMSLFSKIYVHFFLGIFMVGTLLCKASGRLPAVRLSSGWVSVCWWGVGYEWSRSSECTVCKIQMNVFLICHNYFCVYLPANSIKSLRHNLIVIF